MIRITKLTNASKQKVLVIAEDGAQVLLELTYSSTQEAWNMSLTYLDFVANGIQLTVSPNILHNFNNILPFAIACNSVDGFEPKYIDDFSDGRITLFMLSGSEKDTLEEVFFE